MNRRISGEPRLADYISRALEPHIESIEDWTKEDFVALFFGFGNLTLETPARYVFRQTFWRISVDICLACLLYTSPSPRDRQKSRMPSSA